MSPSTGSTEGSPLGRGTVVGAASSPTARDAVFQPLPSEEPYGVAHVTTPSGISIYYQAGPKRLYRVKGCSDEAHWEQVPSVSEVLDVLDKPLAWWGMRIGVEGVASLLELDPDGTTSLLQSKDVNGLVALLTEKKLTVNHVRDRAGDRGADVHEALHMWADKGYRIDPSVFGSRSGYVEGFLAFVEDSGFRPLMSEVMVASSYHGFAGRFDVLGEIDEPKEVVVKSRKNKPSLLDYVPGGKWILDLKTSSGVYLSHHLQLAGYSLAYQESYLDFPDELGILHVFDDGRYELVRVNADPEVFLAAKKIYDFRRGMKSR